MGGGEFSYAPHLFFHVAKDGHRFYEQTKFLRTDEMVSFKKIKRWTNIMDRSENCRNYRYFRNEQ